MSAYKIAALTKNEVTISETFTDRIEIAEMIFNFYLSNPEHKIVLIRDTDTKALIQLKTQS